MRTLRVITAGLLVAAVAAACTYRPREAEPTARPDSPVRGGTLAMALADDTLALDPSFAESPGEFALIRATQRGLTAFPSSGNLAVPVADLADGRPAVSADGLSYSFRIRDGAAFGSPVSRAVTAADVRAGIERTVRARGPAAWALSVVAGADAFADGRADHISGIAIEGERSITITLSRPSNDVLWILALPGASAIPDGTPDRVVPATLAASGPYRVDRVDAGKAIRLVRNASWTRSSDPVRGAWVDAIDVTIGSAPGADVTGEGLPAPAGTHVESFGNGCLLYLFLNTRVTPLDRPRVRAGIAAAIDRVAIVREADLDGTATASLLPAGSAGAGPRGVPPPDAERARSLIGSPFTLPVGREVTGPDAAADAAIATSLTRMLGAAGVRVTALTVAPPGSIYDRYEQTAARVPAGIARWCPDWPGRAGRTMIGALLDGRRAGLGSADYAQVDHEDLNRLIDAALGEPDVASIGPAWGRAESAALLLSAVIPLAFLKEDVPVSARLRGLRPHPFYLRGDPTAVWLAAP